MAFDAWRLLNTGARSAAENVALDQALLEAKSRRLSPNTLRFLQFSPSAVLVGYHQRVDEEVRLDFCRENGIDVARRITGGGAIYFDETQLGWELIVAKDDPRIHANAEDISRAMSEGVILGLRNLGITASFRPRNDIEVDGRKISGTGGTNLGGAILLQGTLLMDFDVETMLRALRIPVEKLKDKEVASVKERVTCLRDQLGRLPSRGEVVQALQAGFEGSMGISFFEGGLLQEEESLAQRYLPEFRADDYVYGLRNRERSRAEVRSIHRAAGGLIRVNLVADRERRQIKSLLITGDFFAFPNRAIFDLEAMFKDSPIDRTAIAQTIDRFFMQAKPVIPGVEPIDILNAVLQAVRKIDYPAYGIPLEDVNSIFTVVQPYETMPEPATLLLPYCAKLPACDFRNYSGCIECGDCGVGDAFRLAHEYGLRPITIQNYENLEETLQECVNQGVRAFIGCCCEPFLAKHREDFERIGLPGILVDVNNVTCYDLGREDDAYRGQYDRLTHLKLDLLEKVIKSVKNESVKNGRA